MEAIELNVKKSQRTRWTGHIVKMVKERAVKRVTVETDYSKEDWWTEVKMGG